jgi:hypothetical protein
VAHTVYRSIVAALLAGIVLAAYEPTLDRRALADAIAIGQSRIETQRARFHQAYRIPVSRPPLDYIDVVTPFRRVVLEAEASARTGRGSFGERDALAALVDGDQLELTAELTFHPLNLFQSVPAYDIALAATGAAPIKPRDIERRPRYGARVDGGTAPGAPIAPGAQPMLGATLSARFDGRLLKSNGVYDAVVSEAGKELTRARIDLGRIR